MKSEGIAVALLLGLALGLAACGPAGETDAYGVVIENGRVVDGEHTGATPGRVLRGPGYEEAGR